MNEREFWLAVRRALLMICAAIEKRYLQPRKDSHYPDESDGGVRDDCGAFRRELEQDAARVSKILLLAR